MSFYTFIINFSASICHVFIFTAFESVEGHSLGVNWITEGSNSILLQTH